MRRSPFRHATVALAALALAVPTSASAQAHFLLEAGVSFPSGDFSKVADGSGYLGRVGLEAQLPHLPLALRAEGEAVRFSSAVSAGNVTVVSGSASVVLSLGGVGGSPYVLAGVGQYRTSFDAVGFSSSIGTGYDFGVGLRFGAPGGGGFVEIRLVNVDGGNLTTRYFPISVGLRL